METTKIKFGKSEFTLHLRDEADISVMREIFKLREYRIAEEAIKSAADPIFDIGAHAGFFSIYCRALNHQVEIVALEPEPDNVKIFKQHLKDNKIAGVKVISGALAGQTGDRWLRISIDSHNHALTDSPTVSESASIKVHAFSLRDFCKNEKVKKISLLKMDIEGGEYEVLENLTPSDYRLFKYAILEYHDSQRRNFRVLEKLLRENGFGVQIFPSKFDKNMGFIFASNKRGVV
ncbi:MAG: FkbM family methyltransferase [Candidatus Magasanikbacteria bacterium]|jgi:FkbM family methyltransferase